ncbi:MAG: Rhs element Vgr protein [Marinilabiliales bacterium]|nr:MAG: Rhs element Vgr protein [Marinilabiliales bacterium]
MGSPTPTGLVNYSVSVDGNELSADFEIAGITTYKGVNKIPYAKIIVVDGSVAEQTFAASSADDLVPGKSVEIKAGYGTDLSTIFKGIIIKHSIKINQDKSLLIIDCRDKNIKLTLNRDTQVFEDQADSDIISTVVSALGLSATVDSTDYSHPKVYKFDALDWDFIVTRAEMNSMLVIADDGDLSVKKPDMSGEASLTLEYGNHIYELESDIDAKTQLSSVSSKSWDIGSQATTSGSSSDSGIPEIGNLQSSDLADVVSPSEFNMLHSGQLASDELTAWSSAKLFKAKMSKICGRVKCAGYSGVKVGDILELKSLGDRFSGKHFVAAVRHDITEGNWFTSVQFGINPEWFTDHIDINTKSASGLIPAVHGLQIAKVKALQDDPDGELRIQVNLPMVDDDNTVWARMAFADAGDSRGICFRPEIDDEVIVGFFNDDIRFPVVLGSLYSSSASAPVDASDDNNTRGIYTKSGIKIEFDDENTVLSIETPAGNKITLTDQDSELDIEDQNGNTIKLSSSGIDINSCSDLNVSAQGAVNISTASGDASISGMNVTVSAQSQLTASGNSSAEVSSPSQTSIKGGIVQIN